MICHHSRARHGQASNTGGQRALRSSISILQHLLRITSTGPPHRKIRGRQGQRPHKMAAGIIPFFKKKNFFFFKFPRTPEEATLGVHPPHLLHQATDAAISGGHRIVPERTRREGGRAGPRPQPRPAAALSLQGTSASSPGRAGGMHISRSHPSPEN